MNMHINTTLHSAPENPEEFLNSVTLPDTVAEKLRLLHDLYLADMIAIDAARAEAESAMQIWENDTNERSAALRAKATAKVENRIADCDTSKKLVTAPVKHLKSQQFVPAAADGAGWLHRVKRGPGEVVDQTAPAPILDVTLVETGLPKGKPEEIVDAQRDKRVTLGEERTDVLNAYDPAEMVKNSLRNQVDALDRSARIGVSINPQSRPKIEWPTQVLDGVTTSRASMNRIHFPDVPALLCRFNREAVLAELFAAVDAQYESVGKTYEPHERKRELKRIDAAILEAERIECEAIWQAIKAGDTSLRFRPDTDIRALLGIA